MSMTNNNGVRTGKGKGVEIKIKTFSSYLLTSQGRGRHFF